MTITRSLAWMGAAQFASLALQFSSSVVLARLLTPHETGIFAIGASTAGVLAIVQAVELEATAFTINAFIAIGLSAATVALSFGGRALLHDAGVGKVLLVMAVGPWFGILNFLPSAHLERAARFRTMSIVAVASGLLNAVLTITLAVAGFSYMSIAYAGLGSGAAYTLMLNVAGRSHVRFRVGLVAWRRVTDFGLQMLAVSGVNSVTLRLSEIALGRIDGLGALGLYSRASALNGLVWTNIHMVIGRVVFVDYASLSRAGLSLRDRYLRTVEIVTAVLWPAFGGFALLAPPFIRDVYGARWLAASVPLACLSVASMVLVSITMTWELFAATGRLRDQTRIEFIRGLVAMSVFAAGCAISLDAAAASRILDAVFAFILYRPHLDRMTDTRLRDFVPIYGRSAVATLAAICPAAMLMADYRFSAALPLPLAVGAIALGMALWAVALVTMRHPLVAEARGLSSRFYAMRVPSSH